MNGCFLNTNYRGILLRGRKQGRSSMHMVLCPCSIVPPFISYRSSALDHGGPWPFSFLHFPTDRNQRKFMPEKQGSSGPAVFARGQQSRTRRGRFCLLFSLIPFCMIDGRTGVPRWGISLHSLLCFGHRSSQENNSSPKDTAELGKRVLATFSFFFFCFLLAKLDILISALLPPEWRTNRKCTKEVKKTVATATADDHAMISCQCTDRGKSGEEIWCLVTVASTRNGFLLARVQSPVNSTQFFFHNSYSGW